ncbi:hypothetical protein LEP1GSC170_5139 [Leptospira interrogans serovar Bataviae str. HAI135]|nr:hypothetical protein LEP1GSC170_5139 [Leptospira interrogans serovar Bataviae str. HAI135]
MINYGKINVVAGFTAMLLAAMGGFALGATFEANAIKDGQYVLNIVRFYLREGHSHGMPIAMYNMVVGLWIDKIALSDRTKLVASWAADFCCQSGLQSKAPPVLLQTFPQ